MRDHPDGPTGPVWSRQIDDLSNVSRPDRSGAVQIDVEHQATDLVLGAGSGGSDVEFDH